MPLKDPEKRRAYHTKYMKEVWYPQNQKKHIGYVKNLKTKVAQYIFNYKKNRCCTDCGFSNKDFPEVLDFDHLRGKSFSIGAWSKSVLSIERVKKEIEKCELVCANCHRIRTFKRVRNLKA